MTRFFFDYTANERSLLDYRGEEFRTGRAAIEFADAIAYNLTNSLSENWTGWSVEVRDAEGQIIHTLRIRERYAA